VKNQSHSRRCVNVKQLFRIWLGVTEYLFRNEDLLDEVINTAIEDNTFRSDDLEFTFAARVSGNSFLFLVVLRKNLSVESSAKYDSLLPLSAY